MRKYSSKVFRKLLANRIINECERLRKFDIRASFGEECDHYDSKQDLFVYRGQDSNDFVGIIKGIAFEYKASTLYCFARDKKYPDSIGIFMAITNGVYSDVSNDTKFLEASSPRGKELLTKYEEINTLKDKYVSKNNEVKR